jgi:hypothetical protein
MGKDEIKNVLLKHTGILDRYKVKSVALFGSYVRDEQERGSDIDLLVEFKKPTFRNYIGLLSELEGIFHRKVDLICKDALKYRIKNYILGEAEWLKR